MTRRSAIDVAVFCLPPMEQPPPPPPEGVGDGEEVVTVTVFEKFEVLEEVNAATRYEYVVEGLNPVSVNVVTPAPTVPTSPKLPPGDCLCIFTPCAPCELLVHAKVTELAVTDVAVSPVGGFREVETGA